MITLQFIGGRDLVSEVIEWFSAGSIAHVDAVMPDGELLGARVHPDGAPAAGVQLRKSGYKAIDKRIRVTLEGDADTFHGLARSQLGKPYDSEAILAFAANRDWRDPSKWFCSELIGWLLEQVHVFPPLATPSNKLPPEMLLVACSALETTRIEEFNGW